MKTSNNDIHEQEKKLAERFGVPVERVSSLGEMMAHLFRRILQEDDDKEKVKDRDIMDLAALVKSWPDLAAVVQAWPELPENVKRQIRELIERP